MASSYQIVSGKIRKAYNGRFATLREAQEYLRGRIMHCGRYRSRQDIVQAIQRDPSWKGASIEYHHSHDPKATGWIFRKGTAYLFIRAFDSAPIHDSWIAECAALEAA